MSIPCFFGPRNSFLNLESCLYLCTLQHCTILCHNVQWSTVFHKTVNYRQDTCLLYDFWGQGTHFWIQNDANVYVLHTTVQFCTKTYSKIHFFTKLLQNVVFMVFGVQKLILELRIMLLFTYCTILYNFVLSCTV